MSDIPPIPDVDLEVLRCEIRNEYKEVANDPHHGFHFHTGRTLARILEYDEELLEGVPESAIESFAGTGNPFSLGQIEAGARVVDIGSGAGIDSLIAAGLAGAEGRVIGVDMTPEMLAKARAAAAEGGFDQVRFRQGYAEELPVEDGWADVVIANGVINLCPDKVTAYREAHRVLKPGGRLQVADILVTREVPDGAKRQIDLWTG
jgi:SAM-dependent methyltransferase